MYICVYLYIYTHTYISKCIYIYLYINIYLQVHEGGALFGAFHRWRGGALMATLQGGGTLRAASQTRRWLLIPQPSTINPKPPTPRHAPFTLNP